MQIINWSHTQKDIKTFDIDYWSTYFIDYGLPIKKYYLKAHKLISDKYYWAGVLSAAAFLFLLAVFA